MKSQIDAREKEGWQFKYDELLSCGPTFFTGGKIVDRVPMFTYTIEVQEFDSKVWKDGKVPENAAKEAGIM